MKNISTKIFIVASIIFGILGILLIVTGGPDGDNAEPSKTILKLLQITVFIILPSFAFSVAKKYLGDKS